MAGMHLRPLNIFIMMGVVCPLLYAAKAAQPSQSDLKTMVQNAIATTGTIGNGLKPWHLKATFQLFDEKGIAANYALDEIWAANLCQRIEWTGPKYHQIVFVSNQSIFSMGNTASPPEAVREAWMGIVHPAPQAELLDDSILALRPYSMGGIDYDCVMIAHSKSLLGSSQLGEIPTYCFEKSSRSLRVVSLNDSSWLTLNQIDVIESMEVANADTVVNGGVIVATGKTETLSALQPVDQSLLTPPTVARTDAPVTPYVVLGIKMGKLINHPNPSYPDTERAQHNTGTVTLLAEIAPTGEISRVEVEHTTSSAFADAAVAAIRQRRYTPATLNGKPVAIETTITVGFTDGPYLLRNR